MSMYKIMGQVLWEALNGKRAGLGLSWRDVAKELDLSPSTFSRLKKKGKGVNGDALVTMLTWLGTDQRYYTVRAQIPEQEENRTE